MSENGAWQILSTGVPITQRGASAAQPERKAQEQADALERLHNGSGSYKREQARLRAAAVAVIALGGVLKARLASRYAMRQDSEEYVFPAFAREYRNNNRSFVISTRFTALLRALGIVQPTTEAQRGNSNDASRKSFHSIRHAVVSIARENPTLTPDIPERPSV